MFNGHDNRSPLIQQLQFDIGCGGPQPYKGGDPYSMQQNFNG